MTQLTWTHMGDRLVRFLRIDETPRRKERRVAGRRTDGVDNRFRVALEITPRAYYQTRTGSQQTQTQIGSSRGPG